MAFCSDNLPLAGIKVLDLSQILAGPMCTMTLADMGADVIKVENPNGGDDSRRMGPPFIQGWSAGFLAVNRNKRSLALDLRHEKGKEVLLRLAAKADVLVQNYRPGTMERLGLGHETLLNLRPSLVYCSISGFGSTGPYSKKGGFDLVAQGMSGLMSITGYPGGPPAKVGVPITDISAGLMAANGILCAYIHALRTGEGQLVDTSIMEAGLAYTVWESAVFLASGEIPSPLGSAHRLSAPYQALRASDGYINLAAPTQPTWEALCCALEREDLLSNPHYKTPADRKVHEVELAGLLEEIISKKPATYWLESLEKAGVVAGPIYDMATVYQDPQVHARDMMVDLEDPELGSLHNIGIPVKLSATPGQIRHRGPGLGEHSRQVLLEAGLAAGEIDRLVAEGVVETEGRPG